MWFPIDVTLGGIVIDCIFIQSENEKSAIDVAPSGIVYVKDRWFDGKQMRTLRVLA